ncbi:3',5'-cyclic adenosine monophosphate phosphodiesterase CpdA [bioreactor metagenome]|uniref:3',5'-cyclic adenosine monophosphate phosphodiesterase CpdA n=1 Tax=bioreactor metagenome TaxID=1076179 RepID=A0A645ALB5_9ZZZZ
MIKLIHAADFHLDTPFRALPPDKAAERRSEQRELLSRFVGLAAEEKCDLVLLSGDLFDGERVYYETAQALARVLGQLGVPVFIAPGNHDPYAARSPYLAFRWPDNVHIFTSPIMESVALPRLSAVVHGCAFTSKTRDDDPLSGFSVPGDGNIHLLCVHGDVGNKTGRYAPIDPAGIAATRAHYAAFGHIHMASGLQRAGTVPWAYPGCPEGRGFDETGEKGVLCGTVSRESAALRFVPLCKRRYEIKTVDVGGNPEEALKAALPTAPVDDICRILLTGESGPEGLNLAPLEAIAFPLFYTVTLRDETRVRRDLWDRAEEDTLTGLFLRGMRLRLAACEEDKERSVLEDAVRFGLAALERGEDIHP